MRQVPTLVMSSNLTSVRKVLPHTSPADKVLPKPAVPILLSAAPLSPALAPSSRVPSVQAGMGSEDISASRAHRLAFAGPPRFGAPGSSGKTVPCCERGDGTLLLQYCIIRHPEGQGTGTNPWPKAWTGLWHDSWSWSMVGQCCNVARTCCAFSNRCWLLDVEALKGKSGGMS